MSAPLPVALEFLLRSRDVIPRTLSLLYPTIACALLVLSCSGPAGQRSTTPGIKKSATLGVLMREQVNPAFSELSFLVFHGDETSEQPETVHAEIARHARALATGTTRLREWSDPPTETVEAREVFQTYSASIDKTAQQLVEAVERKDSTTMASAMEQIAKTCNSCHHFFRLDLEDSVVGAGPALPHSP